jgi:hypothetical protein
LSEKWQSLRRGDKVRLIRLPREFSLPACQEDERLVRIYNALLRKCQVLTVEGFDCDGTPVTRGLYIDASDNIYEVRSGGYILGIDDEAWEQVANR